MTSGLPLSGGTNTYSAVTNAPNARNIHHR